MVSLRSSPTVRMNKGDLLYRYVAERAVAEAIARGIFRFYELAKYIKMEDENGRGDDAEGAFAIPQEEYAGNPEKLPVASFNGVRFHCVSIAADDEYLSQYFVLCMSTKAATSLMGDSRYRVEIHRDQFDVFSSLLNPPDDTSADGDGRKFFSHGPIEYYDIDNHPARVSGQRWKEVYSKHRRFADQHEYRAAFFINESAVERISRRREVIRRAICHRDGTPMDFGLEVHVRAGRDAEGWRFIEIDTCEFAKRIGAAPGLVVELMP